MRHDERSVCLAENLEASLPFGAADAARVSLVLLEIGVRNANLRLCTVSTIVESAEVDEHFLTDRQLTAHTALSNADDDAAGSVLEHNLVVDIARDIVARYASLNLHTVGDAYGVVHLVLQQRAVLRLQVGDVNDVGLLKLVVAERCHLASRVCPVVIHTRCNRKTYNKREEREFQIF